MPFRIDITDSAQRDIDDLARYCRDYTAAFWEEQEARLAHVFETWLANSPHTWGFFFITGAPYRAYLFEVGARTKFWTVYTIHDRAQVVNVLRVWNASQDPNRFRA
jgi:plasmid stabilization system protein ParE